MQKNKYATFFVTVALLFVIVACFTITWYMFYSASIPFPFYRRGNWLIVVLYALLYYLFAKQMGAFMVGIHKKGNLLYAQILAIVMLNGFTFLEISLIARDWVNPAGILFLTLVQVVVSGFWATGITHLYLRSYPPQNLVFFYDTTYSETLVSKIDKQTNLFAIQEFVEIHRPKEELLSALSRHDAAVLCGTDTQVQNEILKMCYGLGKRFYIAPTVSDILVNGAEQIYIFDAPLFLCRSSGLTISQLLVKRITDIVGAFLGIVLSLPIMVVVAILIKLEDGGPVLYKQARYTRDAKPFSLYKFRTMRTDAEADGVARLSSKADDRVTSIGRKLRKTRLDELPQLFLVLKGDLSLIGPRPERPELIEEYRKTLPEFDFRLKVKAGLTGYAQVLGKYSTSPRDKLLLDLAYIENYSFFLDFKIALNTIRVIFTSSSTD